MRPRWAVRLRSVGARGPVRGHRNRRTSSARRPVVIALLGIANTMVLSIMERVREIGLVRAVGMGRRQVRRMIRYEAALVAVFGAVLGVVGGLVIGVAAAVAFPDHYVATLVVPVRPIAVLIGVAALAGVAAAALPARRAARIDVLAAIAR